MCADKIIDPLSSLHESHLNAPNEHLAFASLLDVLDAVSNEPTGCDESCGCEEQDREFAEVDAGVRRATGDDAGMCQNIRQRNEVLGSNPSLQTLKTEVVDGPAAPRKSKTQHQVTDTPGKASEKRENVQKQEAQTKTEKKHTSTISNPPKLEAYHGDTRSSTASIDAYGEW